MPRWLYFLLVTAIFAPIIELVGGQRQELAIFICAAISLIPLAALIGFATEDLAARVGNIAGGLLNATFSNAPEIIIGIFALQQGLISVVKASIIGSIISNMLLVLLSLFFPANLNLVFQPLELLALALGTVLFTFISLDGESSWLEGVQLVTLYTLACVVFFFVPG